MDITVTFNNGRWFTNPDPAIVRVGTKVRWIVQASELTNRNLVWKVSFKSAPPFGEEFAVLKVCTEPRERHRRGNSEADGRQMPVFGDNAVVLHRGATESHTAERHGNFKYDLSVEDASSGERIGEDDPMLIVVRRITILGDRGDLIVV